MIVRSQKNFGVLILAAGLGTRMKSDTHKVLHKLCAKPLITYLLQSIYGLKPKNTGIVLGHKYDTVKNEIIKEVEKYNIKMPVTFIRQKSITGSGQALLSAINFVKKFKHIVIVCGDTPLIEPQTLKNILKKYFQNKPKAVIVTFETDAPHGYGRIIKNKQGVLEKIIEQSHLNEKTLLIKEVNSGTYVFETKTLLEVIGKLKQKGPKKEFYLTDVMEIINKRHGRMLVHKIENANEGLGINSRTQLALAEKIIRNKINTKHMQNGVTFINPDSSYISPDTKIGKDCTIYPNVFIEGKSKIGSNVTIETGCVIKNCQIGDNVLLKAGSYIEESKILSGCIIGPYAHIRPNCIIGPNVKFGNFCEIKSSTIKKGSKVPHLTYVGDTIIGKKVNIGAGTITCNYDGRKKHKTIIEDNVFVGSNVNLVAPIKIKKNAKIGAGSTITEDVKANTLAIARYRQINKKNRS